MFRFTRNTFCSKNRVLLFRRWIRSTSIVGRVVHRPYIKFKRLRCETYWKSEHKFFVIQNTFHWIDVHFIKNLWELLYIPLKAFNAFTARYHCLWIAMHQFYMFSTFKLFYFSQSNWFSTQTYALTLSSKTRYIYCLFCSQISD